MFIQKSDNQRSLKVQIGQFVPNRGLLVVHLPSGLVHLVRSPVPGITGFVSDRVGSILHFIRGLVLSSVAGHLVPAVLDGVGGALGGILGFLNDSFLKEKRFQKKEKGKLTSDIVSLVQSKLVLLTGLPPLLYAVAFLNNMFTGNRPKSEKRRPRGQPRQRTDVYDKDVDLVALQCTVSDLFFFILFRNVS